MDFNYFKRCFLLYSFATRRQKTIGLVPVRPQAQVQLLVAAAAAQSRSASELCAEKIAPTASGSKPGLLAVKASAIASVLLG